jgi:hypothetical protein
MGLRPSRVGDESEESIHFVNVSLNGYWRPDTCCWQQWLIGFARAKCSVGHQP